jgi:hypothetical protein
VIEGLEDTEIVGLGLTSRSHENSDFRVFGSDFADICFDGIGFAPNNLNALLRVFANHARIVGGRDALGIDVIDNSIFRGRCEGRMDA